MKLRSREWTSYKGDFRSTRLPLWALSSGLTVVRPLPFRTGEAWIETLERLRSETTADTGFPRAPVPFRSGPPLRRCSPRLAIPVSSEARPASVEQVRWACSAGSLPAAGMWTSGVGLAEPAGPGCPVSAVVSHSRERCVPDGIRSRESTYQDVESDCISPEVSGASDESNRAGCGQPKDDCRRHGLSMRGHHPS